jgi:hypothetical protein
MRLCEFDETANNALKLTALSQFLSDRAGDQAAAKQISQKAFIELARSMGVNVTETTLGDLISQDPLKNLINPLDPSSGVISFKGNTEAQTGMSVDQAREVVDSNAKAAMKRRQ